MTLLTIGLVGLSSWAQALDLIDLDGNNGFQLNGIDEGDSSGTSVSGVGDINGDGIDDVVIGAPFTYVNGWTWVGASYVVFGGSEGFPVSLELASLDGSNGFQLIGVNSDDWTGWSVSGAGDVNDDGIDDVIIGAPGGLQYSVGNSYVVFGSTAGFPLTIDLAFLDGSNGFQIIGSIGGGYSGASVSEAGDVNGDGIDDLIIGAPEAYTDYYFEDGMYVFVRPGVSYVVFGSSTGFPSSYSLALLDGSNGFQINGVDDGDESGSSVSSAGDVNGDGIDDIIIGAPDANPGDQVGAGESYVVFGNSAEFPAILELASLDGTNGFQINGINASDRSGFSVSGAGDVNGDGIDDLIIGAPWADVDGLLYAGESYVVFGSMEDYPASLDLASLDGSNGFQINGIDAGDASGFSVSGAGDVNSDGIDDLIIGAVWADPDGQYEAGESYLVYGSSTGFPASLELASLDGTNGFPINGINDADLSGVSVSGAGDINGDGIDDLIVGARGADPGGQLGAGESYVVFGQSDTLSIDIDIKPGDERNMIYPRSRGAIWVAVLSDNDPEASFDPSFQVDIPTVAFGPDGAEPVRHRVRDINMDGLGDLLIRFSVSETGIACGDTEARLTAETFEGQTITGIDSIQTIGCRSRMRNQRHEDNYHEGEH